MTTIDDITMEQELRELFASIAPPPAPASWRADHGAAGPTLRLSRGRPWIARRVALVAAIAVIVGAGIAVSRHDTSRPAPAPLGRSPITISVLPAAATLTCRLPISALSADHTTGFVVLDHGRSSFEPVQTNGTTYIPALATWADVLPQMVAPDGRAYATQQFTQDGSRSSIHIVDATGDRTLLTTTAHVNLFAFTTAGILLDDMSRAPGATGPADTLSLDVLDPASGTMRPFPDPLPVIGSLASAGSTSASGLMTLMEAGYLRNGNAIWMTRFDPVTNSTTVRRYDLDTRVTTEWFDGRADGHGHLEVVGTDESGHPIVQLADRDLFHTDPAHRSGIQERTLLLSSPHVAGVLNQGRVGDPGVAGSLSPLSVNDGDQVWLAADDGAIWRYRPAAGLEQIAKVTTSTSGAPGVAISGPCR